MADASRNLALNALLREARELLDAGRRAEATAVYSRVATEASKHSGTPAVVVPKAAGDSDRAFAVTVFSPPGLPMQGILGEVAEAVCHGLQELGRDAVITTDLAPTPRRRILLGAGCLPNARRLGYDGTLALREDTILYQLEQIASPEHFLTSSVLPWFMAFQAWDYSAVNVDRLRVIGLDRSLHVPLGYVPQWARIAPRPPDIDVLFYGRLSDRRKAVLDSLHGKGAKVVALVNSFGRERDEFIARSRIVLNMHHYEAAIFEFPRVLYLLANRRCVVSETGNDPAERDYAGGVAFAPYENLAETCLRLLDAPAERDSIAETGFRLVRSRTMAAALRNVLG